MDARVGHLCRAVSVMAGAALEVANRADPCSAAPLLTVGVQVDGPAGDVHALSVDVLCDSCAELPTEPAGLVALLTAAMVVAEASGVSDVADAGAAFVAMLMNAGVEVLELHVSSSSLLLNHHQLFVPATASPDVPLAPVLLPAASVPKPEDMTGGGFRVDLLLARQLGDASSGPDPSVPGPAMFDALKGILERTALLLPYCDLSLALEARDGCAPGRTIAVHRGDQGDTPLPDRLSSVLDGGGHVSVGSEARLPVIAAVGSAADALAVRGGSLLWAVDVLLVCRPQPVAGTDAPGHALPQEADVVLICQHAVQTTGVSDGVLATLRSKRLAAELWTLCGVHINTEGGALASGMTFKASQAGAPLPHKLVIHVTCTPHNKDGTTAWPRRAVAPLSAARRRKMVCAALLGAFHKLKEQSAALTSPFEQTLRAQGLPAAATAIARILGTGQAAHLAAALVDRLAPAPAGAHADPSTADAAADQLPPPLPPSLAQAVTAALLDALDSACCPKTVTATVPQVAVHAPPAAAEDADEGRHHAVQPVDGMRRRQREESDGDEVPVSTALPKRHAASSDGQAGAAVESPPQDAWWLPADPTTSPTRTVLGEPNESDLTPLALAASPIAPAQTLPDDGGGDWFL